MRYFIVVARKRPDTGDHGALTYSYSNMAKDGSRKITLARDGFYRFRQTQRCYGSLESFVDSLSDSQAIDHEKTNLPVGQDGVLLSLDVMRFL